MELIAGDVEAVHLGVADPDALLVAARIERAFDFQTGFGRRCTDQLDHGKAICERPAAPVLRDVAEQPVLDLVPLRRAGRIVVDTDDEPGLVGQLLQFDLPEPHSRTIRAAAVRRDCQFSCLRIARSSHAIVPATDRRHGELSRIAGDPDADEAGVGGQTTKDEELEHFGLLSEAYRLGPMKETIEDQITSLAGFIDRLFALRNTDAVNRLAMMSVLLGIGALVTGYLGMNIPDLATLLQNHAASWGSLVLTSLMAVASLWFVVYIIGSNWLDFRASILPHLFRRPLTPKTLRELRRYDAEVAETAK